MAFFSYKQINTFSRFCSRDGVKMTLPITYLQNKSIYDKALAKLKAYPDGQFNILSQHYDFYNPDTKVRLDYQCKNIKDPIIKKECTKWINLGKKMLVLKIEHTKTFSKICEDAINSIPNQLYKSLLQKIIYDQAHYKELGTKETISDRVHAAMTMIGKKQLETLLTYPLQIDYSNFNFTDILSPYTKSFDLFESYRKTQNKNASHAFMTKVKMAALIILIDNQLTYEIIKDHFFYTLSYKKMAQKFNLSKPTLIKKIGQGTSYIDRIIRADAALPPQDYPIGK